jgi:hypothetical protein
MMQTTQPWHRCHLVTDAGSFPCFTVDYGMIKLQSDCPVTQPIPMPPI